eukprot:3458200-Alexandrium_andersonii.AAC.1
MAMARGCSQCVFVWCVYVCGRGKFKMALLPATPESVAQSPLPRPMMRRGSRRPSGLSLIHI